MVDKPTIECVASEIDSEGLHYSKFIVEPLERGYGVTLGNSLRRVLLSDLEGAAVTAIKIEGVTHEFTSLPNVVEDVIEIILNIKKIVFRCHVDELKIIRLSVNTPGIVTAGHIVTDADVEIINPHQIICTIEEGGSIEMEMMVEKGKGFIPAERNRQNDLPIGWIPIDAIYMPVCKVNYLVEDTRVGQITDFDRLVLEVWTNGSIEPVKAISNSAAILINKLSHFAVLAGDKPIMEVIEPKDSDTHEGAESNDISIEELELSVRAYNCLKRANIFTLNDLLKKTERELMEIKNFGRKSAEEVIERMKQLGYTLKPGGPRSFKGTSSEHETGE